MPAPPERDAIAGLILAGGRGQRLGGVDKGLQPWRGLPLVDHALAANSRLLRRPGERRSLLPRAGGAGE